jgi:hypothetical protein
MQITETLPIDDKVKTTWLLPRDLVKRVKQYALDHDTNATAVTIEALESFLSSKKESKSKK